MFLQIQTDIHVQFPGAAGSKANNRGGPGKQEGKQEGRAIISKIQ